MPLTVKGKKIKRAMVKQYGQKKGEQVFYASENKGNIKGVKKHNSSSKKKGKKKSFNSQMSKVHKVMGGY